MNIAIGSDHRGFAYKEYIKTMFDTITWIDVGAYTAASSDYPIYAHAVAKKIVDKEVEKGVLLCGTGIGMSIAANRHPGIYAGLVWNVQIAKQAKEDDNINLLVLPADYITEHEMIAIIHMWLSRHHKLGKYEKRVHLIDT